MVTLSIIKADAGGWVGHSAAELEMDEWRGEPGAWNLPSLTMFADPFNTACLVIDTTRHDSEARLAGRRQPIAAPAPAPVPSA
jgi:fructose 1,6-bisphosphatase